MLKRVQGKNIHTSLVFLTWSVCNQRWQKKPLLLKLYDHFLWMGFSSQKFLVLILLTSRKDERLSRPWEPPSGFERNTPGLGIQRFNHQAIAEYNFKFKQMNL